MNLNIAVGIILITIGMFVRLVIVAFLWIASGVLIECLFYYYAFFFFFISYFLSGRFWLLVVSCRRHHIILVFFFFFLFFFSVVCWLLCYRFTCSYIYTPTLNHNRYVYNKYSESSLITLYSYYSITIFFVLCINYIIIYMMLYLPCMLYSTYSG